jgi:hypothetical protein
MVTKTLFTFCSTRYRDEIPDSTSPDPMASYFVVRCIKGNFCRIGAEFLDWVSDGTLEWAEETVQTPKPPKLRLGANLLISSRSSSWAFSPKVKTRNRTSILSRKGRGSLGFLTGTSNEVCGHTACTEVGRISFHYLAARGSAVPDAQPSGWESKFLNNSASLGC